MCLYLIQICGYDDRIFGTIANKTMTFKLLLTTLSSHHARKNGRMRVVRRKFNFRFRFQVVKQPRLVTAFWVTNKGQKCKSMQHATSVVDLSSVNKFHRRPNGNGRKRIENFLQNEKDFKYDNNTLEAKEAFKYFCFITCTPLCNSLMY